MHYLNKENITKKYKKFVVIVRKVEIFSVLYRILFLLLDYFENYNRYQRINLIYLKLKIKIKVY
ncbi:hypothetical protein SAMN02799633_01138 [Bacillus sp. UNCCL81]|nr:hypothetical protein SAMN02799633_01138 [Bacillus sp. UNCCL81]